MPINMKINKSARISLAITTGVLTITLSSMLFMGAFFVNDQLEPALERPGSYRIHRRLLVEDNYDIQDALYKKLAKIEERELTIFEKAFLGLLQGSVFILAIAVLPFGFAVIFKIAPSRDLFYRGIQSRKFRLDKQMLAKAENPGTYKFHRVDDECFVFSKPKLRKN